MSRKSFERRIACLSIVSLLVAVMMGGAVQAASTDIHGQGKSGEVCAYANELQHSPVERQRYLLRLSSALEIDVAQNSAVEEMYGAVREASYSDVDDGKGSFLENFLGLESKRQSEGTLDSFSVDCLGCHDGVSAVSVAINWKNDPHRVYSHKRITSEHPVGMDYQSYAAANPSGYKQIFGSTRLLLVNGKVGCLTCHDPLNPERRHLVMSDRGSALCLTCHNK